MNKWFFFSFSETGVHQQERDSNMWTEDLKGVDQGHKKTEGNTTVQTNPTKLNLRGEAEAQLQTNHNQPKRQITVRKRNQVAAVIVMGNLTRKLWPNLRC